MWMWLTRTSAMSPEKQPKKIGPEITVFCVGMWSVKSSTQPFCSLLRRHNSFLNAMGCQTSKETKESMV